MLITDDLDATRPAPRPVVARDILRRPARREAPRRTYDIKVGGDVDTSETSGTRHGTYVSGSFKYDAANSVRLTPEMKIRGDNLFEPAMSTPGLKVDASARATWTPTRLRKRLQLGVVGGGSYAAVEGDNKRSWTVGASTTVTPCPPAECASYSQLRMDNSYTDPRVGESTYKLDLQYIIQWKYGSAPAPGTTGQSPKRISTTPSVSFKNGDAGWATTVGFDVAIDVNLGVKVGAQVTYTLEAGAQAAAQTLGGLYMSFHPPG